MDNNRQYPSYHPLKSCYFHISLKSPEDAQWSTPNIISHHGHVHIYTNLTFLRYVDIHCKQVQVFKFHVFIVFYVISEEFTLIYQYRYLNSLDCLLINVKFIYKCFTMRLLAVTLKLSIRK